MTEQEKKVYEGLRMAILYCQKVACSDCFLKESGECLFRDRCPCEWILPSSFEVNQMLKDVMANELLNIINVIWDCTYEQKEGCKGA